MDGSSTCDEQLERLLPLLRQLRRCRYRGCGVQRRRRRPRCAPFGRGQERRWITPAKMETDAEVLAQRLPRPA